METWTMCGKGSDETFFAIKPIKEYRRNAVGKFVKQYFGNCFSMISQLVEDEEINAEQLRQLLDMVENKKHD